MGCNNEIPHDDYLIEGFRNPGVEARPRAYWNWLNGDVSLSGITRDLEEAKDKGLGGLQIWDTEAMRNPDGFVPNGPPFLGVESVKAIHHAIKEAERLELELGLICASGWNSGGAWVTPEMASKNLFHAGIVVSGPGQIKKSLPFPEVPLGCPKGSDGLPVGIWMWLFWPGPTHRIIEFLICQK
ncbi:glycosyl hydrolase [Algoriphagus boritolerans]|uniref:glycosyl hydrolase n=1 Tax=Algoriphagus boritolerans TaxID=308111 RepID=UPI002FCDE6CE